MDTRLKHVVVADDHSLFLDGITSLLEAVGYDVVGQAHDGQKALDLVRSTEPDLVLLDITMPVLNGLEVLEIIKEEYPEIKVVILTVSDDDNDFYEAIKKGASGYLLKDLNSEEFLEMLGGLDRGEVAICRRMTSRLVNGFQKLASQEMEPAKGLTERELELLHLMVEGLSNKIIANKLFISENTVKYHIRNILQKLEVQNRTEAVGLAIRKGLVGS